MKRKPHSQFGVSIVEAVESERLKGIRRSFLLHVKPKRVPRRALRFVHTFGLGGSAAVLFGLLVATGMLMLLVYEANPEKAYDSVLRLYTQHRFGGLIRNVHYFSAHLLIAVVLLHMLRVFFTGGFHGPRRINWIIGVVLLFGVMGESFTGYLLPWDQLSYWAVTISTGMLEYVPGVGAKLQEVVRGGREIGGRTLILFYAFHSFFIPIILMTLMGFHFWRVRKAKGVVVPPLVTQSKGEIVPAYPDLLVREVATGLVVVASVLMLSVFFDAPLGEPANPGMSPNPAKAQWYFMGFQELQLHLHPIAAVVLVPMLMTAALLGVPYLKYDAELSGSWFLTRRGLRSVGVMATISMISAPALVILDDLWLRPSAGAPSLVERGVIPFTALALVSLGVCAVLKKKFLASTAEVVQALFTLLFVAMMILTIIGVFFRGEGMVLTWPSVLESR